MRVDIEKIGFYKYETKNLPIVDCVKEYPLTPEIQDYISKNYMPNKETSKLAINVLNKKQLGISNSIYFNIKT